LVHEGSDGTEQENNYYQVKETTMSKSTIQYNLTPREALIIENIRDMASTPTQHKTEAQIGQELMDKYMAMNEISFIEHYAEVVGDDTILSVLLDTIPYPRKWKIIFDSIVSQRFIIDELFESYVSVDTRRQLLLDSQDPKELAAQLVDLAMDGHWAPENR
jgi:hypothetical protein